MVKALLWNSKPAPGVVGILEGRPRLVVISGNQGF